MSELSLEVICDGDKRIIVLMDENGVDYIGRYKIVENGRKIDYDHLNKRIKFSVGVLINSIFRIYGQQSNKSKTFPVNSFTGIRYYINGKPIDYLVLPRKDKVKFKKTA